MAHWIDPLRGKFWIEQWFGQRIDVGDAGCRLDWIIIGGESGPGARTFDVAWARNTVMQCRDAGVACFVKQLGSKPGQERDTIGDWHPWLLVDRKGGDMAEWPEDLRVREFPK